MRDFFVLYVLSVFLFVGVSCAPLQAIDPTQINFKSGEFIGTSFIEPSKNTKVPGHIKDPYYKAFPSDMNEYVKKWIQYYAEGKGRGHMTRYLERSHRYRDLMGDIFEEKGLPKDLIYIAMAESGFTSSAVSTANAVGYWQFIHATGKSYHLKINSYVDDRRDFVLSTEAAAKYLKNLYGIFEDWRLSMSAYNWGEGKVLDAIAKHDSRNFWYLLEKGAIPKETKNYVPKVIAMRKIALSPVAYGFSDLEYAQPLNYKVIKIEGSSSMSYISKGLAIPLRELKRLNPKFKTDTIPEGEEYIRVPAYIEI